MPDQIAIQNVILSAGLNFANEVEANRLLLVGGLSLGSINWKPAQWYYLNITALQWQLNAGDYTSDNTLAVYDCLLNKIGFDTNVATIDPNYQPNNGTIVIVNPASYIAPIPYIPYTSFDPITQQGDGSRYILYEPTWVGLNPVLSLTGPGETALNVGIDYSLIPSGGISLLPTSQVLPFIFPGQSIRAVSYTQA